MAMPEGMGWFGTPDALVDDYFDVLSPSAYKFLWLLLRNTAGYKSYQENPTPLRLSIREIREGRQSKAGAKLGKGSKQSKHTIIEAIRECEDLGLIYVEEDRSDLARIEKKYALLNPGCLGPYCTLDGLIRVDLWCGAYYPRQPVCKYCTSNPSVNDDRVCYGCLADVQFLHSEVQELHTTEQKLHTGGAENAQRSYIDSLHRELEIENIQRAGADAPRVSISKSKRAEHEDEPTSADATVPEAVPPLQASATLKGEERSPTKEELAARAAELTEADKQREARRQADELARRVKQEEAEKRRVEQEEKDRKAAPLLEKRDALIRAKQQAPQDSEAWHKAHEELQIVKQQLAELGWYL